MNIKTKTLLGIAVLGAGISTMAYAVDPGPYVGFQGGISNNNNKTVNFPTGSGGTTPTSPSNSGFGMRFSVGGDINKYFGMEGGLAHYASSQYSPNSTVIMGKPAINENAFDFVGKGTLPLGSFSAFLKAGVAVVFTSSAGSIVQASSKNTGVGAGNSTTAHPTATIGGSYDLTQTWVLDLSATRIFSSGNVPNINFMALGISYHFVNEHCGQFLC